MNDQKKYLFYIVDRHSANPFLDIMPTDLRHQHMYPEEVTLIQYMWFKKILEEMPGKNWIYHQFEGTFDQFKQLADAYRSDVMQNLWHLYENDPEPFHDGGDDFDYDIGHVEMLIQFAHILEDPAYLEPVVADFDTEREGYKHPYHLRPDLDNKTLSDWNWLRHMLNCAIKEIRGAIRS